MNYAKHVTGPTPQTEKAFGRENEQVMNSAGGATFALDKWGQLQRFLILGQEGSTYYATERELVIENAQNLLSCIAEDGIRVLVTIHDLLDEGRAPKRAPAVFALACVAKKGSEKIRTAANDTVAVALNLPTDLFLYLEMVKAFGGRGSGINRSVQRWYKEKDLAQLALHMVKYQNRNNWTHRDALRAARPRATGLRNDMFHYAVTGKVRDSLHNAEEARPIIGWEKAKQAQSAAEMVKIIHEYRLVHECVPSEFHRDPQVQNALLRHMPYLATIRNLAKLSASGLLSPLSDATNLVCERISNRDAMYRAKVHPIQLLSALRTYAQGHGERGQLTWEPVGPIIAALDAAFTASFSDVKPTGKRIYVGLDVSASMTAGTVAGVPGLSPRVAAAAMCMTHLRTERQVLVRGFTGKMTDLHLDASMSIDNVCKACEGQRFGRTDCSAPMLDAMRCKIPVDAFIIYTDNETWCGSEHPYESLRRYRKEMGIDAKLIVVGMTATKFTIADPQDPGMLDVVGFDAAAPRVMSDFMRGNL